MKIYKAVPFKLNNDYLLANPTASGPCDFCPFYDEKHICSKRFICIHHKKRELDEITMLFIEK